MQDVVRLARERARSERNASFTKREVQDRQVLIAAAQATLAGLVAACERRKEDTTTALGAALPPGALFDPAFLTSPQQAAVLAAVDAAAAGRWVAGGSPASPRLVANFGGSPSRAAVTEPLPPFLATLAAGLAARFGWPAPPGHVLVNDYRGSAGLDHHTDGPLYSCSAVVTLSGPALLELRPAAGEPGGAPPAHLLLRPGCALGLVEPAYSRWTHGIAAAGVDVVPASCVNMDSAGVTEGEAVPRAPRRISLVFVCKVGAAYTGAGVG